MKNKIALLLSVVTIIVLLANNYFSYKIPILKEKLKSDEISLENITKISNTNVWIKRNIIPLVDTFEKQEESESIILNIEASLKNKLNTTIDGIDKTKNGIITISITSKILRDDVDNLLKLFKLQVPNGYVKINKLNIESNYVVTNFDLIKFYKD